MMRRVWLAAIVAALGAVFVTQGCDCTGTSEIQLAADPVEISADGISSTLITARVIYRDSAAEDGTTVAFKTTGGSFEDPTAAALEGKAETSAGNATITLYSSTTPGPVTVDASYTNQNDEVITASIQITFVDQGKATPISMRNFDFTCDSRNLGALDPSLPKIQMVCRIVAKTAAEEEVLRPQVEFLTESGSLKLTVPESTTTASYAVYTAEGNGPWDVDPNPDEPSVTDETGLIRNPRDGLVTLVAYASGEESYTDANGNGKYDEGEPFEDIGEPFADFNDNGSWDSGEPFVDVDGNKKYDGPNGRWDGTTKIWKAFKVLWTGKMKEGTEYSGILPTSIDVPHKGSQSFTVKVVDQNLNPVSANDQDDYLSIELDGGESIDTGDKPYKSSYFAGMTLSKGVNGDDVVQGGYDLERSWAVTVGDSLDHEDAVNGGEPYASILKARMSYTPGPKAPEIDQYLDRIQTDWIAVQGMIK